MWLLSDHDVTNTQMSRYNRIKSPRKTEIDRLSRYTTLPVLLDLLKRRKLVLLDPNSWDDKNDSGILLEYKKRKSLKRLLALCFSCGDETVHHWKAFADGISGCCVEFDPVPLIKLFDQHGLRHGLVTYKMIKDVKPASIVLNSIPFTKRWPYRCEEEYRIIREDDEEASTYELDIDLSFIRKITISQKMPNPVYETIKDYLREASMSPEKRVNRSTLYENRVWLNKFKLI